MICGCSEDSPDSPTGYDAETASGLIAGATCGLMAKCGVALSDMDPDDTSGGPVTTTWCSENKDGLISAMRDGYVTSSTKADVDACVSDLADASCSSVCGKVFSPETCNKVVPGDGDTTATQCVDSTGTGGSGPGTTEDSSYDPDVAAGLIAGATCGLMAQCGVALSDMDPSDTSGGAVTAAWCSANQESLIAAMRDGYVATSTKADVDACVSDLSVAACESVCGQVFSPASCNKVVPGGDSTPTECVGSAGTGGSGGTQEGTGGSVAEGTGGSTAQQPCSDTCEYANDGECDEPDFCDLGTDCTDCS